MRAGPALLVAALLCSASVADADDRVAAKSAARRAKAKRKRPPPPPEPEPELILDDDDLILDDEPTLEPDPPAPAPTRVAPPRRAARWYVRAGLAHLAPLSQSREVELAGVDGPASLAIDDGPLPGSGSTASSATLPAATIGYRLDERWSLETVLAPPMTVTFRATGTLATESIAPMALGLPTGVPALGEELAEATVASPLVTLVYQLRPRVGLRPYVGSGVSVLFATDARVTNPILTEVGKPELSVSPAPGLVLQAGVEARVVGRIVARLDVKFVALMLARARAEHLQVRTPALPLFDTVEVGTAELSMWVNPLIVQAGIGTDF